MLFARLVGDDRVHLQAAGGRLLVRPAEALAGLIEVRGLGILRLPYEPSAVVGLVVDLGADAERLPDAQERQAVIEGISLPRLAVADGKGALPAVLALLTCSGDGVSRPDSANLVTSILFGVQTGLWLEICNANALKLIALRRGQRR